MKPEWRRLAQHERKRGAVDVVAVESADISKIPALRGIDVRGFPTMLYFPAPKSSGRRPKPTEYSGDRTAAAMARWLAARR
jgi:hypothetical protein